MIWDVEAQIKLAELLVNIETENKTIKSLIYLCVCAESKLNYRVNKWISNLGQITIYIYCNWLSVHYRIPTIPIFHREPKNWKKKLNKEFRLFWDDLLWFMGYWRHDAIVLCLCLCLTCLIVISMNGFYILCICI